MASDIHLKLEGVDGESTDKGYEKQIDVLSVEMVAEMDTTSDRGGGAGVGKVKMQHLVITCFVDKSTPLLFKQCAKGIHMGKAEFTFKKAGGTAEKYLVIKLDDVFISSVEMEAQNDNPDPKVVFKLAYDLIDMDYKDQSKGGSLGGVANFKWSVKKNAES
jgi:type VI secretion system secreted protein Hcp